MLFRSGRPSNGRIDPVDEGSEELSAEMPPDPKRPGDPHMHMDKHSTQAWTENPMLLPLMAHCEPLQRRGRSFNKDLAWMLVAERYRIVARSSDVPEHDREAYRWQGFKNGFLNLVASFVVATLQLMNTESLIGCMVWLPEQTKAVGMARFAPFAGLAGCLMCFFSTFTIGGVLNTASAGISGCFVACFNIWLLRGFFPDGVAPGDRKSVV